jgi:hypothetical protein
LRECSGGVAESEGHHVKLEESSVRFECGFPPVFWDDLDIVVTFAYIEFAEKDFVSESLNRLTNVWKWRDVFDHVFVQFAEVLYDALRPVFLRDRKGG